MKEHLIEYLKENLNPDAIILHGSRARGMAREGSDWDFILLYVSETKHKNDRATIHGQNIEYAVVTLPITDIWETFGAKLSHAKVVYEKNDTGSSLLLQAKKYYDDGVHWSPSKTEAHKLWLEGRIEGMSHYTDQPEMFFKYFSDIYSRVTNYWYWIKQHKHSEPIYVALKEITDKDPVYADLLKKFTSPSTTQKYKVEVAKLIHNHLFL